MRLAILNDLAQPIEFPVVSPEPTSETTPILMPVEPAAQQPAGPQSPDAAETVPPEASGGK